MPRRRGRRVHLPAGVSPSSRQAIRRTASAPARQETSTSSTSRRKSLRSTATCRQRFLHAAQVIQRAVEPVLLREHGDAAHAARGVHPRLLHRVTARSDVPAGRRAALDLADDERVRAEGHDGCRAGGGKGDTHVVSLPPDAVSPQRGDLLEDAAGAAAAVHGWAAHGSAALRRLWLCHHAAAAEAWSARGCARASPAPRQPQRLARQLGSRRPRCGQRRRCTGPPRHSGAPLPGRRSARRRQHLHGRGGVLRRPFPPRSSSTG